MSATDDTASLGQTLAATPGADQLITAAAEQLGDGRELELLEGALSGTLYTRVGAEYLQLRLEDGSPTVCSVSTPTEEVTQLGRIEPEESDPSDLTVETVVFTGGD